MLYRKLNAYEIDTDIQAENEWVQVNRTKVLEEKA